MGNICECEHQQSQHKASKYGCRALDCFCSKYRFDIELTRRAKGEVEPDAAEVLAEVVPPDSALVTAELAPGWYPAPTSEPDTLAQMSARLAKVEQERDLSRDEGVRLNVAVLRAERERDEAREEIKVLKNSEGLDVVAARAELVSARQETEDVRSVLDMRTQQLAAAQERIETLTRQALDAGAEIDELRDRLDRAAEAGGRDIADGPDVDLPTRIAELRRGRKEATDRVLELAAKVEELEATLAERDSQLKATQREYAEVSQREIELRTSEPVDALRLAEANRTITVLQESIKGAETRTGSIDALRAELAEALAEEDRLRVQRDDFASQLVEARQVIEAMEDDRPSNVIQVEYAPVGTTLARYERWFCQPVTGCGAKFAEDQPDHKCGPLVKATVTITH